MLLVQEAKTRKGSFRLFLGGLAGTVAMTLMMMFVAPMMGVHMDIEASLATMLHGPWAIGILVHLIMGILIFPVAYEYLLRRHLPGPAPVREDGAATDIHRP